MVTAPVYRSNGAVMATPIVLTCLMKSVVTRTAVNSNQMAELGQANGNVLLTNINALPVIALNYRIVVMGKSTALMSVMNSIVTIRQCLSALKMIFDAPTDNVSLRPGGKIIVI